MSNPWINYIDRSYEQIKAAIKAKIKDPITGIPEITDLSEGNDFIKMTGIWSGIAEMLGYWLDKKARESFLSKAKKYVSGVKFSRAFDYRIRGAIASLGEVVFSIESSEASDIVIPKGTKLRGTDGTKFMTTQSVTITAGLTTATVGVIQREYLEKTDYVSTGLANQSVEIDEIVVDNSIVVDVGGQKFSSQDSLAYMVEAPKEASGYFEITGGTVDPGTNLISQVKVDGVNLLSNSVDFVTDNEATALAVVTEINSSVSVPEYNAIQNGAVVVIFTDLKGIAANGLVILPVISGDVTFGNILDMSGGSDSEGIYAFVAGMNENSKTQIDFGDGVNGAIPDPGAITIQYYSCSGSNGNVPSGFITEIVDSITVPPGANLSVTNNDHTAGGVDSEDLEKIKRNLPLLVRTKERAITDQDFIDIAILAPGVHNAAVGYTCGQAVDVYILAFGGGISNQTLLDSVSTWFSTKRSILTIVNIKSTGEVQLKFNVLLYVKPGFTADNVKDSVNTALLEFLGWRNAKIKSELIIGDLYEVIEGVSGVESSYITDISITPYAEPISPNVKQLKWNRELSNPGSEVITWRIIMVDGSSYNLLKNGVFDGYYNVATEIVKDEIVFTILADTYSANEIWDFRTYPLIDLNQGKIELEEFSVITSTDGNITITTEGGL